MTDDFTLYTITQVVELTGLARNTIYDLIAKGELTARKVNGRLHIAHMELQRYHSQFITDQEEPPWPKGTEASTTTRPGLRTVPTSG